MPKQIRNAVFDKHGQLVSEEILEIPDTKIEKALTLLDAVDPTKVLTLPQALQLLKLHHQILMKLLPHVVLDTVYDEEDLPST